MRLSILLIISILFANKINAQTIFVNGANATNGNGTSWAMAFNNLDDAIIGSTSSNAIWLAKGTYLPSKDTTGNANPTDNRAKNFFINKNIKIYGGFLGSETLLSEANPNLNQTILSGDLGIANDSTDNALHVIFVSSVLNSIDNNTVLNGLTITKGNASVVPVIGKSEHTGGGIFFNAIGVSNISPIISNCIFIYNSARTGGACYFNIKGNTVSPIFKDCLFKNNTALGSTETGSIPIEPTGAGGAIRFDIRGIVGASFQNCTFERNRAGSGGSIYNICYSGSSNLTIDNSYFMQNSAIAGGVIYSCSNGSTVVNKPVFTNSVFVNNVGNGVGGCIYNIANQGETSSDAINCTFSKNTSTNGAAMYSRQAVGAISRPTIKNSILWDETSPNNEVTNNPTALSSSTLTNCIYSDGVLDMIINNLSGSGNTFVDCIEKDPLFKNSTNMLGADGLLRTTDDGLNVQINSPAINAGSNAILPNSLSKFAKISAPITKDITSITNRIVAGVVDIGAFENVPIVALPLNLIDFYGNKVGESSELNWETSNESNLKNFEIERSYNAKLFIKVGSVLAKNQLETGYYNFIDPLVTETSNLLYYRLKIMDLDGNSSYSKIIALQIQNLSTPKISPNPVIDNAKISNVNNAENLFIFDIQGKKLAEINSSDLDKPLSFSYLQAGVYFLKSKNGMVVKFVKQ